MLFKSLIPALMLASSGRDLLCNLETFRFAKRDLATDDLHSARKGRQAEYPDRRGQAGRRWK